MDGGILTSGRGLILIFRILLKQVFEEKKGKLKTRRERALLIWDRIMFYDFAGVGGWILTSGHGLIIFFYDFAEAGL